MQYASRQVGDGNDELEEPPNWFKQYEARQHKMIKDEMSSVKGLIDQARIEAQDARRATEDVQDKMEEIEIEVEGIRNDLDDVYLSKEQIEQLIETKIQRHRISDSSLMSMYWSPTPALTSRTLRTYPGHSRLPCQRMLNQAADCRYLNQGGISKTDMRIVKVIMFPGFMSNSTEHLTNDQHDTAYQNSDEEADYDLTGDLASAQGLAGLGRMSQYSPFSNNDSVLSQNHQEFVLKDSVIGQAVLKRFKGLQNLMSVATATSDYDFVLVTRDSDLWLHKLDLDSFVDALWRLVDGSKQLCVKRKYFCKEFTAENTVLRLSQLTGDRFELTVYASGGSADGGSAATLVQEGRVRNLVAIHRVGQLESSQVYVAWVKVFCEGQALESQQKGFKTLPPRVLTIWDKPDHEILGVDKMATSKEIIKSWRSLSLQFHPDKETDPEKKEDAEEMMKRLNIAKQNMLRSCPTSPDGPETPTPDAGPPSPFPGSPGQTNGFGQDYDDPFGGPGDAGYFSDSNIGSEDDWQGEAPWHDDAGGAAGRPGSSQDRGQGAGGAAQGEGRGADGAGGARETLCAAPCAWRPRSLRS
ncbi:unnamed protein product [Prorocentrum cordatum]|uniref:J domain-containing protein n=1 Tax=Prorocentrum cordatum TaxID=2364126 RepID=A0ABN9UDW1_9DINO|nr:unnamed protein product [Polarella glacialis]